MAGAAVGRPTRTTAGSPAALHRAPPRARRPWRSRTARRAAPARRTRLRSQRRGGPPSAEWPPSSKKLSDTPTRSTPRTSTRSQRGAARSPSRLDRGDPVGAIPGRVGGAHPDRPSVRRQRQIGECHEGARHHVGRHVLADERPQVGRVRARAAFTYATRRVSPRAIKTIDDGGGARRPGGARAPPRSRPARSGTRGS